VSAAAAEVRALRSQIRTWRRGRVDTSLMEALSDAYVAVFSALVLGAMAVNVIINVHVITSGGCSSVSCLDARDALGWLFGLAAITFVLAAARLLGPMLVTPAVGTWLLTTPLDRTALVRGRLLSTAVVAALVGAALAATGAALSAYPVDVIGWLTLLAGVVCVLLVGVATVDQARGGQVVRLLAWSLGVVLWVGLVLVARDSVPALLRVPAVAPLRVAVVVTALAGAALLVLAYRSLHLIRRERLVSGGTLLPGISGALASLDLTLFYDILVARHWRARSSVRVVRGRGTGASALVWREVVRLRRTPQVLVALTGALVLPYLATALGLGHAMVLVVTLTGFVAGVGLFTSLRVLSRTASLLRCFPLPAAAVRGACLGVPGAVLVLWGLAATPAVHDAIGGAWTTSTAVALACGVVAATAAVRWMTSRPPDYRLPLITSPMGAVPTSLYFSVLRGFDVLVLGTVPLLVAPTTNGAAVSMALMAAVLAFLVSRP
jgi:hypothetical protein